MSENVELRPYFAPEGRYPALIGVRVGEDEYETAYVSKAELVSLSEENAKLWELAKLAVHSACFGCPHNDKNAWRSCGGCNLYEYSTELGIEVDS